MSDQELINKGNIEVSITPDDKGNMIIQFPSAIQLLVMPANEMYRFGQELMKRSHKEFIKHQKRIN